MGMMQEFKDFAMKGNVVDLAVGVIVGAAFIIFQMVRVLQKARRAETPAAPAEAPPTAEDILLLREIRDALKSR